MGSILLRLGGGGINLRGSDGPSKASFSADATSINEPGYRRLGTILPSGLMSPTTVGTTDDIVDRSNMINQCRRIVRTNPFLQRSIIDPVISLIIGTGVIFKVKNGNTKVEDAIKKYIKFNAFTPEYQRFLAGMLLMEGEILQPLGFDRKTGNTRITFFYSDTVDVIWSSDDNRIPSFISFMPVSGNMQVSKQMFPITELTPLDSFISNIGKGTGFFQDACVYTRTNYLTTRRGLPPLYTLLDYADNLDDYVYDRMELVKTTAQHWLDITVEGGKGDVEEISKKYLSIPKSGTVDVHNKKISTEPRRFETNSTDAKYEMDGFTNIWDMISMLPSKILNNEKQIEAGSTVVKVVEAHQICLKSAFLIPLLASLYFSKLTGKIDGVSEEDFDIDVIFPQVSSKDISKLATAINQISLALLVARQEGWIDHADAAKAFAEAIEMILDTEISPLMEEATVNIDAVAGKNGGIQPQGGAKQSGQSDKQPSGNPFAKYTKNGEKINNSKSKVSR